MIINLKVKIIFITRITICFVFKCICKYVLNNKKIVNKQVDLKFELFYFISKLQKIKDKRYCIINIPSL